MTGTVIVGVAVVIVAVIKRLARRTRVESLHRSIVERTGNMVDVRLVRLGISALRYKGRGVHDLGKACVGWRTVKAPMAITPTIAS